jgi:hypothetical protein
MDKVYITMGFAEPEGDCGAVLCQWIEQVFSTLEQAAVWAKEKEKHNDFPGKVWFDVREYEVK